MQGTGSRDAARHGAGGWTNRRVGLVVIVVFGALGAYLVSTDWVWREQRDGFLLGGFPLFGVAAIVLSAIPLLFDGRRHEVTEPLQSIRGRDVAVVLGTLLFLFLLFEAFGVIGFLIATVPSLFAATWLLGLRPVWLCALVGVLVAGFLRGLMHLLGVEAPQGVLAGLL